MLNHKDAPPVHDKALYTSHNILSHKKIYNEEHLANKRQELERKKQKAFERHINKTHHHHHHIPEFIIHLPEVILHGISHFFSFL